VARRTRPAGFFMPAAGINELGVFLRFAHLLHFGNNAKTADFCGCGGRQGVEHAFACQPQYFT
jgi:hypothetical protein